MTNEPGPACLSSGTPPKKMLLGLFVSRTFGIIRDTGKNRLEADPDTKSLADR